MILGQLRIGARQTKNAALRCDDADQDGDDADDAARTLIKFCNLQRKAEHGPCEPSKNFLSEIGELRQRCFVAEQQFLSHILKYAL